MKEDNVEQSRPVEESKAAAMTADVERLLHQVALQDSAALSRLYDEFAGVLMSVIFSVLKDKSEAEDVLQDTFISIWNKAAMYKPHLGKPTSWMMTVARNKAYDRYRKLVRKSEGMENLRESAILQSATYENKTDNEALDACFQKLNEDQQSAVGLVFYQGLTQQEASDELGAPLGTVKARVRRGLIQLKQCLSISNN